MDSESLLLINACAVSLVGLVINFCVTYRVLRPANSSTNGSIIWLKKKNVQIQWPRRLLAVNLCLSNCLALVLFPATKLLAMERHWRSFSLGAASNSLAALCLLLAFDSRSLSRTSVTAGARWAVTLTLVALAWFSAVPAALCLHQHPLLQFCLLPWCVMFAGHAFWLKNVFAFANTRIDGSRIASNSVTVWKGNGRKFGTATMVVPDGAPRWRLKMRRRAIKNAFLTLLSYPLFWLPYACCVSLLPESHVTQAFLFFSVTCSALLYSFTK